MLQYERTCYLIHTASSPYSSTISVRFFVLLPTLYYYYQQSFPAGAETF